MKYKNTYSKIDELQNISSAMQKRINETQSDRDSSILTGAWDAIGLSKDILIGTKDLTVTAAGTATSLIGDFVYDIGIGTDGEHITAILVAIITVLSVSAILFIIVKRKV